MGVSKANGLQYCKDVSTMLNPVRFIVQGIPAGSFRCERFVKSSLASNMVGFIRGGRLAFESSSKSAAASSIVFVYTSHS